MKVCDKVCKECPFRRKSAQGYLGKNNPHDFLRAAMSDESVACHLKVNQELKREEWLEAESQAPRCRGALTMMNNQCKLPHDPMMAGLVSTVGKDKNVFTWSQEFIDYHENAEVKSWKI